MNSGHTEGTVDVKPVTITVMRLPPLAPIKHPKDYSLPPPETKDDGAIKRQNRPHRASSGLPSKQSTTVTKIYSPQLSDTHAKQKASYAVSIKSVFSSIYSFLLLRRHP